MAENLNSFFKNVRSQFPALTQKVQGQNLVYLDSTNTTLKPQAVIDRVQKYYSFENTNVHRGGYYLSQINTENFEKSRAAVARFIGAEAPEEIVFTRGTTESINLVASSWGDDNIKAGDEILITEMEHHANIVPWQMLCEKKSAKLQVVKITSTGELDLQDFEKKLSARTKLVAVTACSNTLGTFNPIELIIEKAHAVGALVLLDGAQWVAQRPTLVSAWKADFFVFSGHKIFAPTGIGVLYSRKEILEKMKPYQTGGSMIAKVTFAKTTFNDIPYRFEAGTPHIEGVIGLATALEFVEKIGFEKIRAWEDFLAHKVYQGLKEIPEVILYGPTVDKKAPIFCFNLKGAHATDVAQILDQQGVCVRSGHHCTQPLMDILGVPATARASLSIYSNEADIEQFLQSLRKAKEFLL